ncbi:myosin-binding protein 1-like isoform X1 [Zingiber officinale]|uniref:myosin-binding protein 1-like isoform X1 n=1 Tax=Zingiber officinale TaxID=94328 RepID=UPI001C4C06ED|nr:myosin-binding protein 1-like isoform X1 [Zingiber officinale]XP_042431964.1 myosin-binding protein 1-like isoform X1 [Zingiber officinale]XP_042431965.1 myosin-binding protein 1-like isoform X1 [Zingiber officinale]XP_042431966.1 myosin-binding protein 1-like isoform X1 [Zingiber officinale]
MASKAPVSSIRGFSNALSSAVLEWILMFLLFIDALLSYLVTKFSRLCMLQTPCLFCSRLDHIFGNEKPGFYLDLICKDHRIEISPLSFCSVHGNLADMCKSCLLSASTERKSTPETNRQFIGRHKGHSHDHDEDAEDDNFIVFHGDELANIPYLKRGHKLHAIGMEEDKPVQAHVPDVDIPSLSSTRKDFVKVEGGQRKGKEKLLVSPTNFHVKNQGVDRFSHVGYSEVKISSDSDSEAPVTLDEGNSLAFGDDNTQDDLVSDIVAFDNANITKNSSAGVLEDISQEKVIHPAVNISEDDVLEKLIHFAPLPNEPCASFPEKQINVAEFYNVPSSSSNAAEHCLIDTNSSKVEVKSIPVQYEFVSHDSRDGQVENSGMKNIELLDASCISFLDDKKDTCATHINLKISNDTNEHGQSMSTIIDLNGTHEHTVDITGKSSSSVSSQVIMNKDSSIIEEDLIGDSGESMNKHMDLNNANKHALGTSGCLPSKIQEDLINGSDQSMSPHMDLNDAYKLAIDTDGSMPSPQFTEVMMRKDSFKVQEDLITEFGQSMNTSMDLNDAYKLATKRSLSSPRFTEVIMGKDSSRVQEDLKLLISQISAAQGIESPWNEMTPSPRSFTQGDESVLQNITKTLSLERNGSGLESLEGSIVSEVEGEGAVERLKRQIELDRKSISLLFKELEEERNASAIAANQVMAMMTRLQEEKASMQMEAVQYQRMMEEQAEYDLAALQKCNELLAQREKEIKDLQYEVESCRKHYADEISADKTLEFCGNFLDKEIAFCDKTGEAKISRFTELGNYKDHLSFFEEEATYISNCLKKLEKKLYLFSNNGIYDDVSDFNLNSNIDDPNEVSGKTSVNVDGEEYFERNAMSESGVGTYGQYSIDDLKDGPLGNIENFVLEEKVSRRRLHPVEQNNSDRSDIDKQHLLKAGDFHELASFENEVSSLSRRLEALEVDRNFLEHAINSLKAGEHGVQFIQEIARDLQELRSIGINRRNHV